MKIELEKTMLTGMLTVLGKLVNRSAADRSFLALRLEAKDGTLSFSIRSFAEQLMYKTTIPETDAFTVYAGFDAFRDAVRASRGRNVALAYTGEVLTVSDMIVPLQEANWTPEETHSRGLSCTLPENVLELFARAAQVIDRTDIRPVLHGINLNRDGITATSGREMIHFPYPMKVESITIPLPVALLQSKCTDAGTVQFWPENMETHLRMNVGPWEWRAKAIAGQFPNWRKVIPAEETLTRSVTLSPENAAQLIAALRSQPDPEDKLAVCLKQAGPDSLDVQAGKWRCAIPASFTGKWANSMLCVGSKIMLHFLTQGHTRIALGEEPHSPFVVTGGEGRFVAMPLNMPAATNEKENTVETKESKVVEPCAPAVTPLDDLGVNVENFRAKLKTLFEESGILLRKVREAALQQKQKEREFVQARKAIERIRMAI